MKTEKKELDNRQLEITVHVTKTDAAPWLTKTAARMSQHRPIKGFRPGKAPYDIVKREFGEEPILQEAIEDIINETFNSTLSDENINTYGKVKFDLLPASVDEAVVYKATVTLMPTATLGNWQSAKVKRQAVKVTDEELSQALDELATMTVKEETVERPAKLTDKVVVDFVVSIDGTPIEGGTANDFALILGEGRMIPGFEEKIVGSTPNQKLEFQLSFPKDYQAPHLSGKAADFKVTTKQIFERIKPEINDAFAQQMGVTDLNDLRAKLKENILKEKEQKEDERVEIAAIKQITETATYDLLPKAMIEDVINDLVHEFEHSLAHQNLKMDLYLKSINKTMDQVRAEFEPRAVQRIKSSLALGKLAEAEKIEITPKEVQDEIENHKRSAHSHDNISDFDQPEYRRHVANSIINRKIIEFIKEKITE